MTNAPYLMTKHRAGARIGHDRIIDHMFFDGLEDAYESGRLMGSFAEESATEYQFTRAAQDDYAIASLTPRPEGAQNSGAFDREISRRREIAGRKGADDGQEGTSAPRKGRREQPDPHAEAAFAKARPDHRRQRLPIRTGAAAMVITPQDRRRDRRHPRRGATSSATPRTGQCTYEVQYRHRFRSLDR